MKVTVVIPSYNQGHFIEETILSLKAQGVSDLEVLLLDGGSTDNTLKVIERHNKVFKTIISEKDNGQADAINRGFKMATGDILCWLNSDDYLMPRTLEKVLEIFRTRGNGMVIGNAMHFYQGSSRIRGSEVCERHGKYDIRLVDYLIQPSTFWTRDVWERTGTLDENLSYVFDWDWFIRAIRSGISVFPVYDYLSAYRIHSEHKSGTGGNKRLQEISDIYAKYSGDSFSKAYLDMVEKKRGLQKVNSLFDKVRKKSFFKSDYELINTYGITDIEFDQLKLMI
ncbi:MAG TPA: glycosyltransferase family 2 protein [Flavobacteriales bacterium]|nr:glycosyltransferase [Flavobacterium sp.]HRE73169.1 glycosyltransferase family 2 protein [Flavobacteriales bacterium]